MSKSVHSVKLIPYDSVDLDRLSYTSGDLVYDATNGTIRLMDGVTQGGTKIASQTYVTNSLAAYATNTSVNTAISLALTGYATTASLSTYATTASLSTYATTASLSTYITSASLSTTLAGYVTSSGLSTALSGYATTTANNLKAPNANPTFTGTATIPTAIIGGVNIKSFSIAMGAALA
jgi:hypothetical protein